MCYLNFLPHYFYLEDLCVQDIFCCDIVYKFLAVYSLSCSEHVGLCKPVVY